MTTPNKKGDALGKGIRSLLQSIDADLKTTSGELKSSVVEAVTNSGHAPGTVIEEVRRGYFWNGRVFRYAQVRVARS